MTFRAMMQRAGNSAIRRIAVLLVLVLVLAVAGCDRGTPLTLVRAVAAGAPALAPFFDEHRGLGHDQEIRAAAGRGSLQQGDTPGLYGGTRRTSVCDVDRLKAFLTNPAHHRKAQAWADALGITTDRIPGYLDRLTPVLLRHDTLVRNHDYKKGKAVPFDSLLQAGIAVLVDEQGLPAVKCSCGNPLRPFTGDTNRISVRFGKGSREWRGYERSSVVAVRPAPHRLRQLALVDVTDPARGLARPVGTTGAHDTSFDAGTPRTVPDLTGTTFAEASRLLTGRGLAVGYAGKTRPADDAPVTASDPPAGTRLRFGQYVTLSTSDGTSSAPGTSGTPTAPPPTSPSATPSSPSSPSSPSRTSKAPPPPSSPHSSAPPSSSPPSSSPPPSSAPAKRSAPPPPPPSAPVTTSAPPPSSAPVTTSAPPPSSAPVTTSAPAASEPASSGPASSAIT
ncbi:PASTA domain-containing protein [Streptomyces panaciradicis]|nr:PASTA domain-containing protein [Streptomyces panaciradicis]